MNNEKLIIYPKFKKLPKNEISTDNDIEDVSFHYAQQFLIAMNNLNLKIDPVFLKDLDYLQEMMKSMIMRTMGKHHSIQDWMDDVFIDELHKDEMLEEMDDESPLV